MGWIRVNRSVYSNEKKKMEDFNYLVTRVQSNRVSEKEVCAAGVWRKVMLRRRQVAELKVADMMMLMFYFGVTKMERMKNEDIGRQHMLDVQKRDT